MIRTEHAHLILASSSPRRQELIRALNLPFTIQVSDVDETIHEPLSPVHIVETLALRKAQAVIQGLKENVSGIVIGSDTIVVMHGEVLGKPVDEADAARMLQMLQGQTHEVYSGIALVSKLDSSVSDVEREEMSDKTGERKTPAHLGDTAQYRITYGSANGMPEVAVGHSVSKVTFRPMSDDEIKAYVKTGEPLDKAGSYGIQGIGSVFIEKIEGDFYSVMGLPLNLLYQMLLSFGVSPFNE